MNSSQTGGYALPSITDQPPRGLTLIQFIQTVFVGISGLDGTLVRPKWQVKPPKQPDVDANWLALGIAAGAPDANGYVGIKPDGTSEYQRQETLTVNVSVYGPDAYATYGLLRDGFQIPQNLEALRSAKMGFVEILPAVHVPEFINERWFDRYETSVVLRHQVSRVYPIATFLSASGTIHTVLGNEDYLLNWNV